jgi:hypothetical protein
MTDPMATLEPYPEAAEKVQLSSEDTGSWCEPREVRWLCWKAAQCEGNLLEIGTFRGGLTRELALHCPAKTVHSVDWHNPAGPIHLCDQQKPEMLSEDAIGALADQKNVSQWNCNSRQFKYRPIWHIGFVFIDGDHTFEGVKADSENAFASFKAHPRKLTIVWHDYTYPGWPDVTKYLDSINLPLTHVEKTWIAYLDLDPCQPLTLP